jgi:hypothetical protein
MTQPTAQTSVKRVYRGILTDSTAGAANERWFAAARLRNVRGTCMVDLWAT